MHEFELCGERVLLSPNRALFFPDRGILVVADLHWGKAATFRAAGIPLPAGTTSHDLRRLTLAIEETGARQLLIVGDMLHAKEGLAQGTMKAIAEWRSGHSHLGIMLIRGNHDQRAGDPPDAWNIECVDGPHLLGEFALQHHPGEHPQRYVIAGHLHPHVHLRGRGRQGMRLPCFAFGPRTGILPAFTEFTGGGAFHAAPDDCVFVIAGSEVIAAQ